ncbi:hypothetical protein [uncultured Winogradskyella sp.]|uniref:hypothetical protein n=1 Tax=uncultured Winogradskyella sp. TaxID=395353 RepID=UPI0030EC3BCE|tara:strand:+ start:143 stop:343 length:201 start_codon:yes stop_codon:yes gene_type:complete
MLQKYKELKIKVGDYIYFVNEKGEGIDGNFEAELSNDSFRFFNNTTGRSEIVNISILQDIRKPENI